MMLTAYTLIVRYCSFDFFLVVLFASNCGMLFLMKNSGRMNVNMAKRAVGQRVGWAKQWAGGFFKRGNAGMTNSNVNSNHIGNDTMSIHQGITTSNASSSKSLPNISSIPAESIRSGVGMATSIIAGEKADSAQENSPKIKRRGLFGKRKTYTTSLAPSQRIGASTSSIVSPTSVIGEVLGGDDVSVMTGRTKRGFFKRNTNNSATNRSATAPPLDQPATPTMPKHSTHSSTSATATTTILTSKNGTPLLSASPQPQNQSSLSQLDLMLPVRSPSPSALRKELSLNGNNKGWGGPGSVSSSAAAAVAIATTTAAASSSGMSPLPLQTGAQTINSSAASSGSSSPNSSSPKSVSASSHPATMMTTMTTTTTASTGRSLASAINPRSLLSSFTSTSAQKQQQQQQNSAISPVTPTFPPLIVTANTSTTTMPISPRPIKAAGPRTGFLTGSLSTSKLSNVLGGGGGLGSNRSNDAGSSHRGGVYEEEERLEVTMEYQLHQHHQRSQFNPHRRASTTSTVGSVKYSALPSPTEALMYREHHHQHPFAVSGQDHFQQQLSPQPQAFHPMWQISSAGLGSGGVTGGVGVGVRSGSASGDGLIMAREFNGRGSIGSGSSGDGGDGGLMVKEDLLDPVTSAAAEAMEGFDREA